MCNALCQGLDPNVKALADFLAGSVSTSSIAVGNPERNVYVNAFNFYFQDTWQVTKKLSLNYGLRYDISGRLHNGDKDTACLLPKRLQIQGAGIDSISRPTRTTLLRAWDCLSGKMTWSYEAASACSTIRSISIRFSIFVRRQNAADGLQDNPIVHNAVSNYSLSGYNWQTVQGGGASIFPDVTTCTT